MHYRRDCTGDGTGLDVSGVEQQFLGSPQGNPVTITTELNRVVVYFKIVFNILLKMLRATI